LSRRLSHLAFAAGLLLAGSSSALSFDKAELVKAAVIEKIARFIDWPRPPATQFTLCVASDHPQLQVLNAYYENATIAERPVAVHTMRRQDAPGACQVIFLAQKDIADLPRYRALAEKEQILLVAEGADVARNGVHIAFYFDMNRLRLEVNRKALEASGLKASFRLLEVAKIVN
jgi:hypothetical protein